MDHSMLIIVLFVPLLPAFILFKFLNSNANIRGKVLGGLLKGVQVDLGGAFAAYFVLVVSLLYYFEYQRANPTEQVWLVKGNIHFERETPTLSYSNVQAFLQPPSYSPSPNGSFEMNLVVPLRNGELDFPTISFLHPNFKPVVLDLDEVVKDSTASILIDDKSKKISLTQGLVLKYLE